MATTTTTVAPRAVEPTVDPGTTQAGTSSAPAVEAAPAVEGAVAVNPAPAAELPRTGSGIDMLAGFGGLALAVGGLARLIARRRPAEG
jgi:LPXTG-motif cell wall-anchored protein